MTYSQTLPNDTNAANLNTEIRRPTPNPLHTTMARGHDHSNASEALASMRLLLAQASADVHTLVQPSLPPERDSSRNAAPPGVRPPGAPAWLRIGGKGSRARYAAGEGACLWTGREPRPLVGNAKGVPEDARRLMRALRKASERASGGRPERAAVLLVRRLILAGIPSRVLPPTLRVA